MKKEAHTKNTGKYFFWAIVIILIILSYLIIKTYIIALISAFILAYLTKPVYDKLSKKLGKILSAIICMLLVFIIIIIPLATIIGGIAQQAYNLLDVGTIETITQKVFSYPIIQNLNFDPTTLIEKGVSMIISLITSAISYLPSLLISLIVIMFGMYYGLTNWDVISQELKKYLPFRNKEKISSEIGGITNSLVYGSILIALIEFTIAAIAFYLLGINMYLLLPIIIFFFAFIPGLGPTVVWIPMAIYALITQDYFTLGGIIITGIILSFGIDMVLKNKILGGKTKISPLIMLIGILGGISVFGIFGFILGPLILAYTIRLVQEGIKEI